VPASSQHTADLLLYGGRILTLDPYRPVAAALAIAAGRILAVGEEQELRPLVSSHTQTIACAGRTILPGFIDPHVHLFAWASRFCGADVSGARSIAEIQQLLASQVSQGTPADWIRGYGYDEFFLAEKRHPTKQDVDQVSPNRPILLRHRTGHAAVLNSAALTRACITTHFIPPDGGQIERDPHSGEPTGVVYEVEQWLRTIVPPLPTGAFTAGITRVNTELLRHGVTSFHDASAGNTLADFALLRRFSEDRVLFPRATVMIGMQALPDLIVAGLTPFHGNDQVRLGSIKILLHESRGTPHPSPEDLAEMVWQAHRHGFQVALHAVEEGPLCTALYAIALAQQRLPRADHRHRIEHCALCPPPLIDTLVQTGSAVVTQPGFLYFYGEKYATEVDSSLHDWLYRTRSLLSRGVPVVGSSDCPIAPLAPLAGIQAAMTRRSQMGTLLNPQEQLPLLDALALYTTAGAWIGFEEQQKGRIRPGMLADLVVLDRDLTTVPVEEIHTVNVTMTIVGGEIVWREDAP
jgi:predicted amidohydrolase YtcJ